MKILKTTVTLVVVIMYGCSSIPFKESFNANSVSEILHKTAIEEIDSIAAEKILRIISISEEPYAFGCQITIVYLTDQNEYRIKKIREY